MGVVSKVSIIIPAQNEESTLAQVLNDLRGAVLQLNGYEVEVICVDDHSTDRTAEIARSFGVRIIANNGTAGKGKALLAGFDQAAGDILVMMDADYSHRAEDLPLFLGALKDGVGLVIGSRVLGGSEEYTHIRAFGNVLLSGALGLFTGRYLSDALNGYKVLRRDIITDFQYTARGFEIEIEIIANTLRKGYQIVEISSHERVRAGGNAKSHVVQDGTRFLLRILYEGFRGVKHDPAFVRKDRATRSHRGDGEPRSSSDNLRE